MASAIKSDKAATQILSTGRAGRTRAGRANGQTAEAERRALELMTPQQRIQSANRYVSRTTTNR